MLLFLWPCYRLYAGIGSDGSLGSVADHLLHIAIYGRYCFLFRYALAGWILAWAFIRCQNVWTPMILHALGNVLMGNGQAVLLLAPGLVRWLLGRDL